MQHVIPAETLRGMSLQAAFRLAVALSRHSDPEIAAVMGWSKSVENRVFSNENYYPSLPNLTKFCDAVGNTIVPQHVMANCNAVAEQCDPIDAVKLLSAMGSLFARMGAVAKEGEAALANDGKVDAAEAKRILRRLQDVICECSGMMAGLQARIEAEK